MQIQPKLRLSTSYNFACFVFFVGSFLNEISRNSADIIKWLPINSNLIYAFIPSWALTKYFFMAFRYIYLFSLLMCALRIKIKAFSMFSFAAGFIYFLLIYSTGIIDHQNHLIVLILFLFACFENGRYEMNLQQFLFLVRLSFCLVFFSSGLTKLLSNDILWFNARTHLNFLLIQRFTMAPKTTLFDFNFFAIKNFEHIKYIFIFALPLELLSPLALYRKFRVLVLAIAVMQIFAGLFFFAAFWSFLPVYILWLDIEQDIDKTVLTL